MKKRNIISDPWALKRIIKEYYEQLYPHTFDNLDKIDQFIERHNWPKLTQEETDDLNKAISIKEVESIINNLPKQKASYGFAGELEGF